MRATIQISRLRSIHNRLIFRLYFALIHNRNRKKRPFFGLFPSVVAARYARSFCPSERVIECGLLSGLKGRWRRLRQRYFPSPTAIRAWLEHFHDAQSMEVQVKGISQIPAPGRALQSLWCVQQAMISFLQRHRASAVATLDMDATLIATNKRDALFCYKKFRAYRPLNCWWAEQQVMLHSEFRDGNVPAGYEHLRVLKDSLARAEEAGVEKVYLRADSAAYQEDLLLYCGEGKDPRYGKIEFAVSADMTPALRKAVRTAPHKDWMTLWRKVDGQPSDTGQQWAEVCFVPSWAGHSKKQATYRFIAIREPLRQLDPGDADQLPFPVETFGSYGHYKMHAIVTNRELPADQLIAWHRKRCGKSEELHSVLKGDLAGGQMPSGKFGANAAWWALSILSHTLTMLMKRLVLGAAWIAKHMKALRFHLINLAGRVVRHARSVSIQITATGSALETLIAARRSILALADPP